MNKRNTLIVWIIIGLLVLGLVKNQFFFRWGTNTITSWQNDGNDMPIMPEMPKIPILSDDSSLAYVVAINTSPVYVGGAKDLHGIPCPIVLVYNKPQLIQGRFTKTHVLYPKGFPRSEGNRIPSKNQALYITVNSHSEVKSIKFLNLYHKVEQKISIDFQIEFPVKVADRIVAYADTVHLNSGYTKTIKGKMNSKDLKSTFKVEAKSMEPEIIRRALEKVSKVIDPNTIGH